MFSPRTLPSSWHEWRNYLGDKRERKACHNTIVWIDVDDNIYVRYHATDIACFEPNGTLHITNGGFRTKTTKTRLNSLIGRRGYITQVNFVWYLMGSPFWRNAQYRNQTWWLQ